MARLCSVLDTEPWKTRNTRVMVLMGRRPKILRSSWPSPFGFTRERKLSHG